MIYIFLLSALIAYLGLNLVYKFKYWQALSFSAIAFLFGYLVNLWQENYLGLVIWLFASYAANFAISVKIFKLDKIKSIKYNIIAIMLSLLLIMLLIAIRTIYLCKSGAVICT